MTRVISISDDKGYFNFKAIYIICRNDYNSTFVNKDVCFMYQQNNNKISMSFGFYNLIECTEWICFRIHV